MFTVLRGIAMKAVLYTTQLEPITVLDVPMFLWQRLEKREVIRLPVLSPVETQVVYQSPSNQTQEFHMVEIFAEKFRRYEHEALMLFTYNEEYALRLQASFLAGQLQEVQDLQATAHARGFVDAWQRLINGMGGEL